MKHYLGIAAWALLTPLASVLAQENLSVASPDASITLALQAGHDVPPVYTVTRHGETIIAASQLRLQLPADDGFQTFEVTGSQRRSVDERYRLIVGKTSQARDFFNEITVSLRERGGAARRLDLVLRAYDDGVAFRYVIPSQPGFGWPADGVVNIASLGQESALAPGALEGVQLVASGESLQFSRNRSGLAVRLPAGRAGEVAIALKIRGPGLV